MNISLGMVAFGAVMLGGIVLFATGRPNDHGAAEQARQAAVVQPMPAYAMALNQRLAAYAAAVGPHAAPATAQAAGVTLRSVGFDLPASDRAFPPGPGVELMAGNCQSCHSVGMILNQPSLTRAEWTGEVTKMLHAYKAPVSEDDVAGIVGYLTALKTAP